MKAFITGADGLLGANLVRELLGRGIDVKAGIQPGSLSTSLDGLDIERVEVDLLADGNALVEAMAGCDVAFHCAAITDQWAPVELTWKVNRDGTQKVLDACVANGIRKLVYVGTASCYGMGPIDNPGNEESPFPEIYRGVAYVDSKEASGKLVKEYIKAGKIEAVTIAPTFMIGPYDTRPSSGELIRQFVTKKLKFTSPGGRSFANPRDIAVAMANAVDRGRIGETYICGGANLSYMDFFTRVAKQIGMAPPKWVLPEKVILAAGSLGSAYEKVSGKRALLNYKLAQLALIGTYYSSRKAIEELGMPQTDIDVSIGECIEGLKKYGHLDPGGSAFRGKVAIITGASRGVGFATARLLAAKGARVVITARGEKRLMDSKAKLEAMGAEVAAVAGDVGDWDDAQKMAAAAMDSFGRIDILVNNAGVSMRGKFTELTADVCRNITRTNLLGCILPTKAAIDEIVKNKGNVVFISSIAGLFGLPGASIYCATKKALTGLAESMRIELAPEGVHVGVVYLGYTEHDPEKRILAADGTPVPPDRPAHHTQAYAASLITEMLEKRKKQIIMTPVGKLGAVVYRLWPSFVEKAILTAQSSQWSIFKKFS